MSCDIPTGKTSKKKELKWYDWLVFFLMLAGYGAMMALALLFVNGGLE
jgi:hypothetical protein